MLGLKVLSHVRQCHAIELFGRQAAKKLEKKGQSTRLTIFQKLEIVDFALSLTDARAAELPRCKGKKKKKTQKKTQIRNVLKGCNRQQMCLQKFPHLGGIQICRLIKAAEEQSWRSLSIAQQKKFFHLPDSLKCALGLQKKVRGWKSLGVDAIEAAVKDGCNLQRWNVPGPVLQEGLQLCVVSSDVSSLAGDQKN